MQQEALKSQCHTNSMAFYHAMCCFRVIQLTANWFYMFTILYQSEKVAVLNKSCLMIWLDFVFISTPFWNASLSVSIHLSALRQYKIPRFPSRHRFGMLQANSFKLPQSGTKFSMLHEPCGKQSEFLLEVYFFAIARELWTAANTHACRSKLIMRYT